MYKEKKILTIGAVAELTNLTERQIRYYEERKLIQPERTNGGTRRYSILDVEKLIQVSNKLQKGQSTFEIRKEERKKNQKSERDVLNDLIKGQLNAVFRKKS